SVPFWKIGSDTRACSSSKLGSAVAGHARSPVACGQGEGLSPHRIQLAAVGAVAAVTALASLAPMAFGWPTVNCAATRMLDVAVPLAAAHARRGAYLVHAAARVASEGALAPSSAAKSDATWIGL